MCFKCNIINFLIALLISRNFQYKGLLILKWVNDMKNELSQGKLVPLLLLSFFHRFTVYTNGPFRKNTVALKVPKHE